MKIQKNYMSMTDEQLVTELEHRANTFGDNLSTYTTGAEQCIYNGKEYYFGMFDDDHQSFSLYEPQHYDMQENEVIIEPDNLHYRDLLIQLLESPFIVIYSSYEYAKEHNSFTFYDQQQYLENMKCIECNETHAITDHLLILNDTRNYWILAIEDEE